MGDLDDAVAQAVAAVEDALRTASAALCDAVAANPTERALRWHLGDGALQALRAGAGTDSPTDLMWRLVGYWIDALPEPDTIARVVSLPAETHAELERRALSADQSLDTYLATILTQAAARTLPPRERAVALVYAPDGRTADEWVQHNADGLTGWKVTSVTKGTAHHRVQGMSPDAIVLLCDLAPEDQIPLEVLRAPKDIPVVRIGPLDAVDLSVLADMHRTDQRSL